MDEVSDSLIDEIFARLDQLGEAGIQLLEITARKIRWQGITGVGIGLFLVLVASVVAFVGWKVYKRELPEHKARAAYNAARAKESEEYASIFMGVISVFLSIAGVITIADNLPKVFAPDGYAIRELLQAIF